MAVDPAIVPAVTSVPAVTQTVPDKIRYLTGASLMALGGLVFLLGVIILTFPSIGGVSGPPLQYGPLIFAMGVATIWDRQAPILKLP